MKYVILNSLELMNKHWFRLSYKSKVKRRLLKITAPTHSKAVKKEDETDGPKIKGRSGPLIHLDFVVAIKNSKKKESLTKEILLMGGAVKSKVAEDTAAVISTPEEVEKMNKIIQDAEEHDIHVVSEDFVEEAKDFKDAPTMLIKKKAIAPWGSDPATRVSKSIATV